MNITSHLHRLAIVIWVLIALAYMIFFLADLRLDFAQIQVPCTGTDCNYLALSQAEIDVLESWGMSSWTYSIIMNGATVLAVAASWIMGGVILWRQGSTRIGWAVSLALIVIPITMISDADNLAITYPLMFIPSTVLSVIGTFMMLLFFYIFPNGRFYPRWTLSFFITTFLVFTFYSLENTGLISISSVAISIGPLLIILLLSCAAVFQIMRYRQVSTIIERQQTKWILLGIIILIFGFPVWFLVFGGGLNIPPGQSRLLASIFGWLTNMFFIIALPIAMAISILRYRLWDIDLVIRRTLQYALLTGLLALVYFGSIVILQSVFRIFIGQHSALTIVISTLLIAALFNPLRLRLQEFIDRRLYRQKYDMERTMAHFSRYSRDEVDMDRLALRLVEVVDETIKPESVALWLRKK